MRVDVCNKTENYRKDVYEEKRQMKTFGLWNENQIKSKKYNFIASMLNIKCSALSCQIRFSHFTHNAHTNKNGNEIANILIALQTRNRMEIAFVRNTLYRWKIKQTQHSILVFPILKVILFMKMYKCETRYTNNSQN